jgi:2'-5' RNA ligase
MRTIGVSISVPEPWGSHLQDFRVNNGDAAGSGIPTHITLVPPLEVEAARVPEIEEHLAAIARATAPYRIHLRGSGTFRPVSPVVFLNLVEGISQTEQLALSCRTGPLAAELQYPYHPHVTVAHVDEGDLLDRAFDGMDDFDCAFEAAAIHLYVHDPALGWQPVRDFELTGPAG